MNSCSLTEIMQVFKSRAQQILVVGMGLDGRDHDRSLTFVPLICCKGLSEAKYTGQIICSNIRVFVSFT